MKKSALFLGASAAALSVLVSAGSARAQEQDAAVEDDAEFDGLDTIVVTAQRRQESVQDVPIAISAFTARELETRGVTEALDVAQFVPNLVGLNNTGLGSANSYYLRGLGNSETIATFDPPVGTYVDDIYLSRQNANNLSFFDVERVEVLRGPQGTLFGRNTTGGAINVILAEPDLVLGGYAEAGYGAYERYMARASVDIPLADTFAIKVSGYFSDDEGYAIRSVAPGGRTNDSDGWGVRLGALGELSEEVRWTGSYMHTVNKGENLLNFDCDPSRPDECDGRFVTTGYPEGRTLENSPFVTVFPPAGRPVLTGDKQDFGLGNYVSSDIISSNFQVGFGDFTVNLITGFVHLSQEYGLDFADGRGLPSIVTPTPPVRGFRAGGFTIANDGIHDQFTQEVKLTGSLADGFVDLVAGVFYFKEENKTDFGDIFTLGIAPGGFPLLLADRLLKNETEAYAAYAQADFNVTDALKLTAGVRYTDEEKTFSIRDNRPAVGGGLCFGPNQFAPSPCLNDANLVAANGVRIPTEQSIEIFTPRFAVNYDLDDDVLLFASATRGFKSGGWNARGTSPSELLPFDPEKVWNYEAGFKSELFDRRLRFNLTGYYLDVTDLQTPSALIRDNGSIGFITRNFANYENFGVEIELQAEPAEGLNLFFAGGYQNDEYKFDGEGSEQDEFGVTSVLVQQANCLAQLAEGRVAGGDAPACGNGIVAPDGSIAEPVRTPDFTIAFGGSYEIPLGGRLSLTPAINANWRDDQEVGTNEVSIYDAPITSTNGTPANPADDITFPGNQIGNGEFLTGSFSESRWIVNGSLRFDFDDRYSLTAECRNCLDEEAVESALANYSYLNPPRTFLIKAGVRF